MAPGPDQFQPITAPAPDWSAPVNWTEKAIPVAGDAAIIAGTTATVDPGVTLSAALALEPGGNGRAALIGNGGAITLGDQATLAVGNALGAISASLFAADSLVNHGLISVAGQGAGLEIVVDLGAITGQADGPAPSFSNQGMILVGESGLLAISGTELGNAGSIVLNGGTLDVAGGNVIDTGYVQLEHGGYARFSDGMEFQTFDFGNGGGTISLADPWIGPGITLANFGIGDEIDLAGQPSIQLEAGANAVTLLNGSGVAEGTLDLAAPVAPDLHFEMVKATAGSTIIVVADPPCFASGTGILTPCGYRSVETLAVGDQVVTASGGIAAIIWTGWRHLDIASHPRPDSIRPIRILPGALAPGVPCRALRLSPDHALFLGDVLIPVKHLVNGATILRESDCQTIAYHHLELTRHQVVLAEGAPCETYFDTGNRAGFTNGPTRFARSKRWDTDAYAPLCTKGPVLQAVRQRLLNQARSLGFRCRTMSKISLSMDGISLSRVKMPGVDQASAWCYTLPARHDGQILIRSDRFVPAEFDAASGDERHLGVALSGIMVEQPNQLSILLAVDPLVLGGFHPRAAGDVALWTDGTGKVAIPTQTRGLTMHIAALPLAWHRV